MNNLTIVILAAGKGTRMKSSMAKVLHHAFYKPMLHHVIEATEPLKPAKTVVIIGHQREAVSKALEGFNVETVIQEEQLGTGHAVQMTEQTLKEAGTVMVLCGDSPLIRPESLLHMVKQHKENKADISVMTTLLDNPFGYGRILSEGNSIKAIVEEKEATDEQRSIQEVNAGIYLVDRDYLFSSLSHITPDNSQGEFYLTDIIEFSVKQGKTVHKYINSDSQEALGVNSRVELEAAYRDLQKRRNIELMQQGITLHNSLSIAVSPFSEVGRDTVIFSGVQILGSSKIGEECEIGNGAIIRNSTIGNNVKIGPYAVLENAKVTTGETVAALTHINS